MPLFTGGVIAILGILMVASFIYSIHRAWKVASAEIPFSPAEVLRLAGLYLLMLLAAMAVYAVWEGWDALPSLRSVLLFYSEHRMIFIVVLIIVAWWYPHGRDEKTITLFEKTSRFLLVEFATLCVVFILGTTFLIITEGIRQLA